MLRPGEPLIHDGNAALFLDHVGPDGERRSRGLVPRDYGTHPAGCYASAPRADFPTIPRSEWSDRIKELERTKSRLSDIMLARGVPCLDQNGKGYCWSHSTTGAVMALRAAAGLPTVALSAYAVACVIKHFRDQGGWGAESMDFVAERGVPSEEFWPQRSMDRANDNPRTWENAALHKVSAGWWDVGTPEYDRNLTEEQEMTLLLCRVPVVSDFNWWSHSVVAVDPVEVEPGSFGKRIRNSWGESWGDKGFGVLQGGKARTDGAVAPRVTLPSFA